MEAGQVIEKHQSDAVSGNKASHSPYLDISAVSRKVHLHHEAGDVPAAVDAVQLGAECQIVEVNGTLGRAHSQVTRIWTEPVEEMHS